MSFLNTIISSIGTEGASPYVPPSHTSPGEPLGTCSIIPKPKAKDKPGSSVSSNNNTTRRVDSLAVSNESVSLAGTKGKAEDRSVRPVESGGLSTLPPTAIRAKKKNSFAAIMARGKEVSAKNDPTGIGSIKHKPKEKSKAFKEVTAERRAIKEAIRKGLPVRNVQDSKNKTDKNQVETKKAVNGEKPQTATSSYKGTIKSTDQPKYAGTMKSTTGTQKYSGTSKSTYSGTMQSGRNQVAAKRSSRIYDDDESDNSYGRDDDGYYDDTDDDMDAGFDVLEDEEEQTSRAARREDALAQAELERHAAEKAKKRALLAKGKR